MSQVSSFSPRSSSLIKIAIVDDHPMVIGGIQNMLSNYAGEIIVKDTYLNGTTLLAALPHKMPDVLLLDIQLPDHSGDELLPSLRKQYPELKILVVTNFNSPLYLNNMIRLGAHGYLLKTCREETLLMAIRSVYRGELFIDPPIIDRLSSNHVKVSVFNRVTLTIREKEILQLVANGLSNQEIVEALFLSINTVKSYLSRIFLKMDVKNRAELTRKALEMGLVK